MATRLSVITTRAGDDGTTGLGDGSRVPKDDARITALGDVDELNSMVGLLRTENLPAEINALLSRIQNQLFDLGAELCIPGHLAVTAEHVAGLDAAIHEYNAGLGKLQEFILPGGSRAAALAHVARSVCRRAERAVVALERQDAATHSTAAAPPTCNPGAAGSQPTGDQLRADASGPAGNEQAQSGGGHARQYLNRLSDLCFVLSRVLNRAAGTPDVLWQRD